MLAAVGRATSTFAALVSLGALADTQRTKFVRGAERSADRRLDVRSSGFGVSQSQLAVIAAQRCHDGDGRLPAARLASLRAKQAETFRALRLALIANGIDSINEQARVLCLPRSTAWFVLQSNHKWRGLNAAQVVRMLRSQCLPEDVRRVVLRYVHERAQGTYGHTEVMRRKFVLRLEKLGWNSIAEQPRNQSCRPGLVLNP